MNSVKLTVTLTVLLMCEVSVVGTRYFLNADMAGLSSLKHSKGDYKARVRVVEYFNFDCPHCVIAHQMIDDLYQKYPSELCVEVQSFPFKGRPHGIQSSLYAECAAQQGKFWPMYEALFAAHPVWHAMQDPKAELEKCADVVSLNRKKLNACLEDPKSEERIWQEKEAIAARLGVKSTPTFFVNGEMAVGVNALKEALKKHFPDEKFDEPTNSR